MTQGALFKGVGCALAAGLVWGLVFIAPVLLPGYPAAVLSVGRYLAFGLIALVLALGDRDGLARLNRADWVEATWLSLVGNLVYYGFLAAAIQMAGAPLPTMIIGTLPVVIAVSSNLAQRELAWGRLAGSLVVLAAGIALVNHDELGHLARLGGSPRQLLLGALLAAGAVVCWTWYPIRNARWLKRNTPVGSVTWATPQVRPTLPLARAVWFLRHGADPAATVARAVAGDPGLPAGAVKGRERPLWFLDQGAPADLPYFTCRY